MKRGDKMPVFLGGHEVAMAEVKELGDGTVTLVVPATMVVMGTRTELADLPAPEPTNETLITGVDRPEASAPVGDPNAQNVTDLSTSTNQPVAPAPAPEAPAPAPAQTSPQETQNAAPEPVSNTNLTVEPPTNNEASDA